jgi:hypothetical protein
LAARYPAAIRIRAAQEHQPVSSVWDAAFS